MCLVELAHEMSALRAVGKAAMERAMAKKGKCKKATGKVEYL